jgi:TetR/AcrR family transcriptional regulator, regulator of autoinduction and epiphytic fitness
VARNGHDGELVDGRVRRGERNREAIADAVLALLQEGELQPAARDIAARAGVSVRSVFQHFDDLETLYAVVVDKQFRRVQQLASIEGIDTGASFEERVRVFVGRRCEFYEQVSTVRRAAVAGARASTTLKQALAMVAAQHARDVAVVFATELRGATGNDRRAALVLATSWEAWERLRQAQRCSAGTAQRVVEGLVRGAIVSIA